MMSAILRAVEWGMKMRDVTRASLGLMDGTTKVRLTSLSLVLMMTSLPWVPCMSSSVHLMESFFGSDMENWV